MLPRAETLAEPLEEPRKVTEADALAAELALAKLLAVAVAVA